MFKKLSISKLLLYTALATMVMINTCKVSEPDVMRYQQDLSGLKWNIWVDSLAPWEDDSLYLPPVNLKELKVNIPTGGWDKLYSNHKVVTGLPATVEQFGPDLFSDSEDADKGDYVGVSWFYTVFSVPDKLKGKQFYLNFESVRLRAEVYLNNELVGYDLIGNTPFSCDISDGLVVGKKNYLAVRITDPGGNFSWEDSHLDKWGSHFIPPSHGFGGITGKVKLVATDQSYIEDVFIRNRPEYNKITSSIALKSAREENYDINIRINEENAFGREIFTKKIKVDTFKGIKQIETNIHVKNAKLWSLENPVLYVMTVEMKGSLGSMDMFSRTFGFRWFEVQEKNGDKCFALNGKKIFISSAISWGFWPINGIFPTEMLAEKEIRTARKFSLNMLNMHRVIASPALLEKADKLGLLIYEEPGGYRCPEGKIWFWKESDIDNVASRPELELAWKWREEKLMRMIKRDRSHPSLVIYNMINEALFDPDEIHKKDMREAHLLDPTRIITFSSHSYDSIFFPEYQGACPHGKAPSKLFMLPYDSTFHFDGWYDEHHALGKGVYIDRVHYTDPGHYYLYNDHPEEIIFYGEEGAISAPSKFGLIKNELNQVKSRGWDGKYYLNKYEYWDCFLSKNDFLNAFPSVDALVHQMGNVANYYHGRMIENCRINNCTDAYVINGWESPKNAFNSGIVDIFRNPKGDPGLIARYNQALYVAVKARNKVLPSNQPMQFDFFLVNQPGIEGAFVLEITVNSSDSNLYKYESKVLVDKNLTGQLLTSVKINSDAIHIPEGYLLIDAKLKNENGIIASGNDEVFIVNPRYSDAFYGQYLDKSGVIDQCIKKNKLNGMTPYSGGIPKGNFLVLGKKGTTINGNKLSDWISSGHCLVILDDPEYWIEYLKLRGVKSFGTSKSVDSWKGCGYFCKKHSLLDGLPANTVFNWEYQVLLRNEAKHSGIHLPGANIVVGFADYENELSVAVGVIPMGKGRVVISTLDILPNLITNEKAAVVAERLFTNYLTYANGGE